MIVANPVKSPSKLIFLIPNDKQHTHLKRGYRHDRLARQHLTDSDIRVFDCTTHLIHQSSPESDAPYIVQSGKDDYDKAHIPGAAFIDLQQDLSDTTSPYRFTCLRANQLAEKFGALGIGDNTTACCTAKPRRNGLPVSGGC
ncbi:MAG: hypothetical protein CM1200mP41_35080 [Gammaproteobacteria bacterium]|nr:MAG: hypothetical protein CM1200mP41_35080 [Gammaproteobacteria bacterium]